MIYFSKYHSHTAQEFWNIFISVNEQIQNTG